MHPATAGIQSLWSSTSDVDLANTSDNFKQEKGSLPTIIYHLQLGFCSIGTPVLDTTC